MTDAEKIAVLELKIAKLCQEVVLLEQTNKAHWEEILEQSDELVVTRQKLARVSKALSAEESKQEGRRHAYKQQAKMETLQKLDGYLMALSEIGNGQTNDQAPTLDEAAN